MTKSITTRLIILLTICGALIVGAGMLLDYRLSREEILKRLDGESSDKINAVVSNIEDWLDGVEGATLFLGRILEQREYSQPGLQQMLRDIVVQNEDIFGAAIALSPEQTEDASGFAPYYFRRNGAIAYADLASSEANYQSQAWYTGPIAAGKAIWSEPYFDTGGAEVMMITFSVPAYRIDATGQRYLYAVITADVMLHDLHKALQSLHLGNNSYSLLLSREGILLSGHKEANLMRHYSEVAVPREKLDSLEAMLQRALAGETLSRQIECPEMEGQCTLRLGALRATGWPIGVVYSEEEVLAPLRSYQIKTSIISATTLLLMALAVYLVTHRLTRPLAALSKASNNIARGNMDSPLPVPRGEDEIATLIRSFSSMSHDLKAYISDLEIVTASRSRLEGELAAAREIQMSMLPGNGELLLQKQSFDLWSRVRPAKTVGGDLYTCLESGNKLVIAVGDVSDKGVPAALFMAKAMGLLQQMAIPGNLPTQAMAEVNNALEQGNDNCMFLTLFLGVLDLDSGELLFGSGGHTPPSLVRDGQTSILAQDSGPALGLVAGLEFPLNTFQLLPGDRLAIFTDGVDEAFNDNNEMFGIQRFNQALVKTTACPVEQAGDDLFTAVDEFAGGTAQSDDITLMLLQLNSTSDTAEATLVSREFSLGENLTSRVQAWLEPQLVQFDFAPDTVMEITLVSEEIVTNIQKYAMLEPGDQIGIALHSTVSGVALEVSDGGRPFDPLKQGHRSPLGATIDSAEIGGLGVHLITQLTERQTYRRENNCNILRVEKDLPGKGT